MAISGKVTAATVASAATTIVSAVVARHTVGSAIPSDVLGLLTGAVTAGVTFVSGYFASHMPATVVKDAEAVVDAIPSSAVAQVADQVVSAIAPAPVSAPLPKVSAPTPSV